jgi:hypothetical protein
MERRGLHTTLCSESWMRGRNLGSIFIYIRAIVDEQRTFWFHKLDISSAVFQGTA